MRRRIPSNRQGTAVVEAALALPIIFLVILGTVEICNSIFIKQSLSLMAFEGARVAIIPGASLADVEQQVAEMAAARRITIDSVVVNPSDFYDYPSGSVIEVQVNSAANQSGRTGLFTSGAASVSVFIMKEQE